MLIKFGKTNIADTLLTDDEDYLVQDEQGFPCRIIFGNLTDNMAQESTYLRLIRRDDANNVDEFIINFDDDVIINEKGDIEVMINNELKTFTVYFLSHFEAKRR